MQYKGTKEYNNIKEIVVSVFNQVRFEVLLIC